MRDVIVIGAGAAGLTTAIFARRFEPSRSVTVVDGARRPGAKILVSGGSRCNVTNAVVTERDFWGGRASIVRRILRAFTPADAIRFFEEIGVALHEEADGKLFPDSNRARDVLDALLREIDRGGAELLTAHRAQAIVRTSDGFEVVTAGSALRARCVVLATGGRSLPKSGSDGAGYEFARAFGHTIVPTTPALVPLVLEPSAMHRALAGVSHDVELCVWIDDAVAERLAGSLLWTHFGVSGPVALNASRHWLRAQVEGRPASITINFCPGSSFEAVDERLREAAAASPRATALAFVSRLMPASVAAQIVERLGLASVTLAHLPRDARRRLTHALVEFPLPVVGSRGYTFAEATAGGVALDEIDSGTLESRLCPGLYLVGEILDVDGRIGGFNFHWAWATGFAAGRALGRRD